MPCSARSRPPPRHPLSITLYPNSNQKKKTSSRDKQSATWARPRGSAMPVKQLPSLMNPIPAARAASAPDSCPLRITCAGNGGCPDILIVTWPQAGSMM